jgi:hypothetical protein
MLRKWPSVKNERVSAALHGVSPEGKASIDGGLISRSAAANLEPPSGGFFLAASTGRCLYGTFSDIAKSNGSVESTTSAARPCGGSPRRRRWNGIQMPTLNIYGAGHQPMVANILKAENLASNNPR